MIFSAHLQWWLVQKPQKFMSLWKRKHLDVVWFNIYVGAKKNMCFFKDCFFSFAVMACQKKRLRSIWKRKHCGAFLVVVLFNFYVDENSGVWF